MEFCKKFNARTGELEPGILTPVVISVFQDRSFDFITKTPPASTLLLKAAKVKKGSGVPNREKAGKISIDEVRKIAELKMPDLYANEVEKAINTIKGTARSMGLDVVE